MITNVCSVITVWRLGLITVNFVKSVFKLGNDCPGVEGIAR